MNRELARAGSRRGEGRGLRQPDGVPGIRQPAGVAVGVSTGLPACAGTAEIGRPLPNS